ncbi:sedoheptulose 7-phosphate cyclase [Streptomyces sp. VNUA116]|uniref:sedoheptulose 7-phosphate cyclase n=1 Tax=Streptomyces sp. VNUA116 TaxID=3062449 RepID=UPI0026758025|nr:sedoheptulose 7-phosphate cyclase [Streptomyces sp. VNUA116]WKU48376.1 sedoheptulose 7-phosphate cyclase [Streptomyces sp. VNUA116]
MSPATQNTLDIEAELQVKYHVAITRDVFSPDNPLLLETVDRSDPAAKQLVILDAALSTVLRERVEAYFAAHDVTAEVIEVDSGEINKNLDTCLSIVDALERSGARRQSNPPIAIGGNVLIDVAGFSASIYRRGIPWVRVPTTLLGMIDGSVSAKTAVNHQGNRNRLGTFHPAMRTVVDTGLLASLPRRHLVNGCGEILKMAMIKDSRLFSLLEEHGPELVASHFRTEPAEEVVTRAIDGMQSELRQNLWEKDLRRIVDYGHTFSPPIEMAVVPELLHGEAVAIDCLFTAVLSYVRGRLSGTDVRRVARTMHRVGLPLDHPLFYDIGMLERAMEEARLHRDGSLNLPVVQEIGSCTFTQEVTREELHQVTALLKELAQSAGENLPAPAPQR